MCLTVYSMSTCRLLYRSELEQVNTEKAQLLNELHLRSTEIDELKKRYKYKSVSTCSTNLLHIYVSVPQDCIHGLNLSPDFH